MYYFNDKFYNEVEEIIEDLDLDCMDENATIKVENCDLEPIITLNANLIVDSLENHLEDRYSEYRAETEYKRIVNVLKQNIDFDKINSELPKLWYPNNTFETYSKAQLLSFLE